MGAIEMQLEKAARLLASSGDTMAFTGAGISAESGLPTFRGEGGIWGKMDAGLLEIGRFNADPAASWGAIRELFYTIRPKPNAAHRVLADWEGRGLLSVVVSQNIDGLHSAAGSRRVVEFHGSVRELLCLRCGARVEVSPQSLEAGLLAELPPRCAAPASSASGRACGGLLKPDFVFFGEGIPSEAYAAAFSAAEKARVCLIVGSTGVVYPAAQVPIAAKRRGASIIELDPGDTEFSAMIADIHIKLGASEALERIDELLRAEHRGA
jgi:NAD-dependent deacetylase